MALARINNRDMGGYVAVRTPFRNNNNTAYAHWLHRDTLYAAWSYGKHFPMYVWTEGYWFGNGDHYSRTTARHLHHALPECADIIWMNTNQLKVLISGGYSRMVLRRLKGEKV